MTVYTSNEGLFAFPDLTRLPSHFPWTPPALRRLANREPINAAEHRSLGKIKLEVGQVSETVTVTADAVTVNMSNGSGRGRRAANNSTKSPCAAATFSTPSASCPA